MSTVTLRINLGNAAMQTGDDVARALREVAANLDERDTLEEGLRVIIRDLNGNRVGQVEVSA